MVQKDTNWVNLRVQVTTALNKLAEIEADQETFKDHEARIRTLEVHQGKTDVRMDSCEERIEAVNRDVKTKNLLAVIIAAASSFLPGLVKK